MAARTTAVVSFTICFILGVDCSSRGAVANGGSWGGCVDNGGTCGVVFKLSNRFFGALAGARFFFGFRPRLLGMLLASLLAHRIFPPDRHAGRYRRGGERLHRCFITGLADSLPTEDRPHKSNSCF